MRIVQIVSPPLRCLGAEVELSLPILHHREFNLKLQGEVRAVTQFAENEIITVLYSIAGACMPRSKSSHL